MAQSYNFNSERAKLKIARLLEALKAGPMTVNDLSAKTFMHRSMTLRYIAHLKDNPRRVRRTGQVTINGSAVPLYGLGSEPDALMTTKTNEQKWAEFKAAFIARDPEGYKEYARKKRDVHRAKREAKPKLRDVRVYDVPLEEQVYSLLAEVPGYTHSTLTARLGANPRSIITAVRNLRKTGRVQKAANSASKEFQWEVPSKPLPAPIVRKPQGIFAALGV